MLQPTEPHWTGLSIIFKNCPNISLYGYTIFCFHLSVHGYLCGFHFLIIVSNVAMNISVQVFAWIYVFLSLGSRVVGLYVTLVLLFWGTKLFSKVATPFYILIGALYFLYILANILLSEQVPFFKKISHPRICLLILEREVGVGEWGERETLMWGRHRLHAPLLEIEPTAQVCALTGNWTPNLLVHGTVLQQSEPPSQGKSSLLIV